jgi:hypothetical protein
MYSSRLQGAFREGRQVLLQFDTSTGEFLGSKVELGGFLLLAAQARQQRSRGGSALITAAAVKEDFTALTTAAEMGLMFAATSAGTLPPSPAPSADPLFVAVHRASAVA